jgi:hypothetical protein
MIKIFNSIGLRSIQSMFYPVQRELFIKELSFEHIVLTISIEINQLFISKTKSSSLFNQ